MSKRPGANEKSPVQPDAQTYRPGKKNPVQSMITTLPIIMLLGGLAFYYLNEKKQIGGQLLLDQIEVIDGEFSGISQQSDKVDAQRILWIKTPSRLRGGRIDYQQARQLKALSDGDSLQVWVAPKVEGSKTLWVVKAASDGNLLVDSAVETTTTK